MSDGTSSITYDYDAKATIRTDGNRDEYWIATYISHVRSGGNVFTNSEKNAYRLAVAVGYGRLPAWDSPHGGLGYYCHYHAKKDTKTRIGGHIFYI